MPDATLTLCELCAPETAEAQLAGLQAALADAGLDVAVRGQACLNSCAKPQALALQGVGRASYVFHDIAPDDDMADILGTVRAYLAAEGGWIADATACGRLRLCLRARLAALSGPGDPTG